MIYSKNMYQIYMDDKTKEQYKELIRKQIDKNLTDEDLIIKISRGQEWLTDKWEEKNSEQWYKGLMLYEALCDEAHNRGLNKIEKESWVSLAAKILKKKRLN